MNSQPTPGAQGRRRPPTDIALRLRNWFWYWMVKTATQLSDDALDREYLPSERKSGGRARMFERIRSVGSDPSFPREDLRGDSLLLRVHAARPELEGARRAFLSPLWKLLSEPTLGLADYCRVITELVAERGWYRATHKDLELAGAFIGDDPAFGMREDQDHVYSAMLVFLMSNPSPDNIALLAALFREALAEVHLGHAIWLRSALRTCTTLWTHSFEALPSEIGELLERLVDERLVRNIWRSPAVRSSNGTQRRYVVELVKAFKKRAPQLEEANAHFPLVLRSPRIEWLEANRTLLENIRVQRQMDFEEPFLSRAERASRGKRTRVPYAPGEPPPRDMSFCLPVVKHAGARNEHHPKPYLADGTVEREPGRSHCRNQQ